MKAVLLVLLLCVFAVSAGASMMMPLSNSTLSAVTAGNHTDDYYASLEIKDKGQQNVNALNLINAIGPVQVGTNVLVAQADDMAGINKSEVSQTVVNAVLTQCSMCDFDDAGIEVEVKDKGQQDVNALNVINGGGSVQVGTNIIALCSGDTAGVNKSSLSQCVVNVAAQGGGGGGIVPLD